jgi:hypothetical protein
MHAEQRHPVSRFPGLYNSGRSLDFNTLSTKNSSVPAASLTAVGRFVLLGDFVPEVPPASEEVWNGLPFQHWLTSSQWHPIVGIAVLQNSLSV